MDTKITLIAYSAVIVVVSLLGGWLPRWIRLTHLRTQLIMSLVAGLMLGVGFFVMLPHATEQLGSVDRAAFWMVVGVVVMFVLIRAFHFHQHEPVPLDDAEASGEHAHRHSHEGHDRAPHDCSKHGHGPGRVPETALDWVGLAVGLSIHTILDGVALAASVMADAREGVAGPLLGLGTFLAVALHKPLDSLSITALMTARGWSFRSQLWVNICFSLICPLGVLLFFSGMHHVSADQSQIVGIALAFSAGVFLCISLADLMPELELHTHHRVPLTLALLLGLSLAYGLHVVEESQEPGHASHAAARE